jgi:predicted nucleic acid-binding protein
VAARQGRLLIDNSAWARIGDPDTRGAQQIAEAISQGLLVTCLPFLLEAGYSVRSGVDHERLMAQLGALPHAAITDTVERNAITAQRELARSGHHRIPPVDVLTAAIAHTHGTGVLHCDRHYDVIVERSFLTFPSVWLAGSQ